MLDLICTYKNRQVIINQYRDEELIKRNGFSFDVVRKENGILLFFINDLKIFEYVLPIKHMVRKDGTFPNYFVIESENAKTEIYFP